MKKGIYNILFGTIGQVVILILGICVPRFVLRGYGDEANGLINAIGQIFTYLALIEAGVGQAALQELYGPIAKGECKKTNSIMSATQQMYRRLTGIYAIIVLVISVCYPWFIQIEDTSTISFWGSSYWAVFLIIFIQGMSNVITFYFVATLRQILVADGCNYINANITTFIRVGISVTRVILINVGINLVLLQLVYVAFNAIEAIIYYKVLKRKYSWLNTKVVADISALSQRDSFVIHEICSVILHSTDVLVLSMFCGLKVASIYSIYNLVFSALNMLITQIHSGCMYILGQNYSKDKNTYMKVHDTYDTCYISFVSAMIGTAYLLLIPFIRIYTSDVSDMNYVDSYLPILFCMVQLLICFRSTSDNLIKLAGEMKRTIGRAVLETVINLGMSLVLVQTIGIYGVLLGTIVALLYRTNDMIIYANKTILGRSPLRTYKTVVVNCILFMGVVVVEKMVEFNYVNDFVAFVCSGVIIGIILVLVFMFINLLTSKQETMTIAHLLKRLRKKKNAGT